MASHADAAGLVDHHAQDRRRSARGRRARARVPRRSVRRGRGRGRWCSCAAHLLSGDGRVSSGGAAPSGTGRNRLGPGQRNERRGQGPRLSAKNSNDCADNCSADEQEPPYRSQPLGGAARQMAPGCRRRPEGGSARPECQISTPWRRGDAGRARRRPSGSEPSARLQAADGDGPAWPARPRPPRRRPPTAPGRSRPGWPRAASARVVTSTVRASRAAVASASRPTWASLEQRRRPPRRRRPAAPASSVPPRRSTSVDLPSARSRGPTSTRTGTPLSSQSTARRPNDVSTRSSSWTRTPARSQLGG